MKIMTKGLILFLTIFFIGCSDIGRPTPTEPAEQVMDSNRNCDSSSCYIYYDDFAIQRIFGVGEKDIKTYAIRYDFDYKDLRSILKDTVPSTYQSGCKASGYCDGDIKVKIVLHDDIFFVDSMGYMRKDKLIYQIDKNSLQELMEMKEKNN